MAHNTHALKPSPCKHCGITPALITIEYGTRTDCFYQCINEYCIEKNMQEKALENWEFKNGNKRS